MLIHIVCWKYKPGTSETDREKHRSKLSALAGLVPEVIALKVSADVLHLDRSYDTGLIATFADRDALDRYTEPSRTPEGCGMGRALSERAVSIDFLE
jgi:hypothetical protein